MTTYPGSPRMLKGALVGVDPTNPVASVILFQYNPETLTRRLEPRAVSDERGDQTEAYRLSGPPKETISVTVEVDAADQLERGDPQAVAAGVYPALSALELLVYPNSQRIIQNTTLAQAGNIEIIPPEAPMTLFVWGPQRVLPVRVTSFSITEQAYDQQLNPLRADVELSLQVLSTADFKASDPGHQLFLAHQIAKEALATTNIVNSTQHLGTSLNIF
jgi:hypothetical protein